MAAPINDIYLDEQATPSGGGNLYDQIAEVRRRKLRAEALMNVADSIRGQRRQEATSVVPGSGRFGPVLMANVPGIVNSGINDALGTVAEIKGYSELEGSEAKRRDALRGMLGARDERGEELPLTSERAVSFAELGVDPSLLRAGMKGGGRFDILRNMSSFAKNPAAIRALVDMGELDPSVGMQMIDDLNQQADRDQGYKTELAELRAGLGAQNRSPSDAESYAADPEGFLERVRRTEEAKNLGKGAGGAGNRELKSFEAKAIDKMSEDVSGLQSSASSMQRMADLVNNPKSQLFSDKNRFAAVLTDFGTASSGPMAPLFSAIGASLKDGDALDMNSATIGAVLSDMKLLSGPDSDRDVRTALSKYPQIYNNPKAAAALVKELNAIAQDSLAAAEERLAEGGKLSDKGNLSIHDYPGDYSPAALYRKARATRLAQETAAEEERLLGGSGARTQPPAPRAAPAEIVPDEAGIRAREGESLEDILRLY